MKDVGMKECSYENLTDGIVAIHSGFKLWDIINQNNMKWKNNSFDQMYLPHLSFWNPIKFFTMRLETIKIVLSTSNSWRFPTFCNRLKIFVTAFF